MISVTEFVLCIDDIVYEKCIAVSGAKSIQASEFTSVENGDNDDDVIYDYAPAA
ncbi:hypothetical protein AALP_AA4G084100 [Arabis alpina]|uniref:Uncharacterized protein n=1 Tax=Arabis alpina TaxID=50452 RepID=A0A087H1Z7_ARAAL|nr:hypothetical protein AALP_AA4G084100 [Arabis alpina]